MRGSRDDDHNSDRRSGAVRYEWNILNKYKQVVYERVGRTRAYLPEVKGLKPSLPKKYDGEDNLEVFDRWLMGLLRYFRLLRICGPELDEERVVICGEALEGIAASWYDQEVEATE